MQHQLFAYNSPSPHIGNGTIGKARCKSRFHNLIIAVWRLSCHKGGLGVKIGKIVAMI